MFSLVPRDHSLEVISVALIWQHFQVLKGYFAQPLNIQGLLQNVLIKASSSYT